MSTKNIKLTAVLIPLLLLLAAIPGNAQNRYEFRNGSKISGTDRQVGAQYRFPNVKTGLDAIVKITAITGGLTINTLDGTSSGFGEAFQPVITLPARSKGYAEFTITFVTAGTTTPVLQTEVAVTPIDIDGEVNKVYEFDEIFRSGSSYVDYNLLGGAIKLNYPAANLIEGINTAGITYNGVDTNAKQCMFTVVNANISSIVLRVGADNKSSQSQERLRSVYFQKFSYPNSVLDLLVSPVTRNNVNTINSPDFKVFPTIFNNAVRINFRTARPGVAHVRLVSYSGIIVKQQMLDVLEGNNKITIHNWGNIPAGNYVAIITQNNTTHRQKIIKQ